MKVLSLLIVISVCCVFNGCKTDEGENRPIVSPDKISTDSGCDSEPSIPYYKPIWEK